MPKLSYEQQQRRRPQSGPEARLFSSYGYNVCMTCLSLFSVQDPNADEERVADCQTCVKGCNFRIQAVIQSPFRRMLIHAK